MGKVGLVGDWRRGCVKVPIDDMTYYYNRRTGVWYNSEGETDFEIEFDLDGMRVFFDAMGRIFTDMHHIELHVEQNTLTEGLIKKRYNLDGKVSFYKVERDDMPIYRQ